jgi:site-specific recombinase XerD
MHLAIIQKPENDWERLVALVVDSVSSRHTRRAYAAALREFLEWHTAEGRPPFSKAVVQAYRASLEGRDLSASSINIRLSAIRKLAQEAADNGLMAPDLAAGIGRVKGARRQGVRLGSWLTAAQAEALLGAPDTSTLKGLRDRALLCVLIGCGLRRSEAAALTAQHVQQREGRWIICDMSGKHGRVRSVPMPCWAKAAIDAWREAAGITEGRVFVAMGKGQRITGTTMSDKAIANVVGCYSRALGFEVAAHDLRRTYAKLAHTGHAALEQIQLSLGHASIQTTERYLGVKQDLQDAPCDRLGLRLE